MSRVDIKHMRFDIAHGVHAALKAYVEPEIVNGKLPRLKLLDLVTTAAMDAVIEYVMVHVGHNQVRAAKALGINRNTLRKYLRAAGKQ